ncbi:MAG: sarcosine oxidase subunit gamma [Limimaricola sp.]|nr:sarcosine oxidase subunit gamma [Limimaricola sp.]
MDRMASIAPFAGKAAAVGKALKKVGLGWPAPGTSITGKGAEAAWFATGKALVIDADVPDLAGLAAVTDQTDGWAAVRIEGAGTLDVLARLLPVDLRALAEGGCVRTVVGHMQAHVTKAGPEAFRILVFRSMARTLVHELGEAMAGVAARG